MKILTEADWLELGLKTGSCATWIFMKTSMAYLHLCLVKYHVMKTEGERGDRS
jgi:hypothetical protein